MLLTFAFYLIAQKEIFYKLFAVDFVFFFLSGFSFTNIQESQDCRVRGRAFL